MTRARARAGTLASAQSQYAPEVLRLIEERVLQDSAYVERLKAHDEVVRRKVDAGETRGAKLADGDA
jgi:hypothetical protein